MGDVLCDHNEWEKIKERMLFGWGVDSVRNVDCVSFSQAKKDWAVD